jgi:hypothetical protein
MSAGAGGAAHPSCSAESFGVRHTSTPKATAEPYAYVLLQTTEDKAFLNGAVSNDPLDDFLNGTLQWID